MSKRAKPLLQDDAFTAKSKRRRKRDPAQPNLPLDPMPDRVEPSLALLKTVPSVGPDWAFEIKWDGYRVAMHIEPKGVQVVVLCMRYIIENLSEEQILEIDRQGEWRTVVSLNTWLARTRRSEAASS
jgi:hypothetical protein